MGGGDFAHGPLAERNRKVKAERLWLACHRLGVAAVPSDHDGRRALLRVAGIDKASELSWAMVKLRLEQHPPRYVVADGCSCTPDPVTGVLWEFEGWPCPHGLTPDPSPPDDRPPALPAPLAEPAALPLPPPPPPAPRRWWD